MIYFVPTPIGNIEDITIRSKNVLENSEFIICEDPRVIDKLLKLLGIRKKQRYVQIIRSRSLNFTEIDKLLKQAGCESLTISVVTDAGTPGISDPGYEIIQMIRAKNLEYSVLPGATSIIPAVVASGLINKDFLYLGFLPTKKGRQKTWDSIIRSQYPVVILESVHRIQKLITEAKQKLHPETQIFIGRELTKAFESYIFSTVGELDIDVITQKGEFVIIIRNQDV